MKRERFERALAGYLKRKPFRPFTLELLSGGHVEVTHPETLTEQYEMLVHVSSEAKYQVFEIESIVRFIDGLWGQDSK